MEGGVDLVSQYTASKSRGFSILNTVVAAAAMTPSRRFSRSIFFVRSLVNF